MKISVLAVVVIALSFGCGSGAATPSVPLDVITAGAGVVNNRVTVSFDLFNYGPAPVSANLIVPAWAADHESIASPDCTVRGDEWSCGTVKPGPNGRVVHVSGIPKWSRVTLYRVTDGGNRYANWTEGT